MSIFISIASYKDPELVPTIEDCLAKADRPEDLRFGIVWQKEENDHSLDKYLTDRRFCVWEFDAKDSKGCCWSRAHCQSFYSGETYFLQLDSHHRFEPHWDTTCIRMLAECPSPKPILTAYVGGYTPEGNHIHRHNKPWKMVPKQGFTQDGCLLCVPKPITPERTAPVPARFLSAHFLFTRGEFIPYDPNLYFTGEEPSLTVRAFTHGYDLFHPYSHIVWHEYTRKGRVRHWDEHNISDPDKRSKARVRKLLGMEENEEDLTGFGLGTERTLAEYEDFTGIDFKGRRFHEECFNGDDPPTTYEKDAWAKEYQVFVWWSGKEIEIPINCSHVAYFIDDAERKFIWHENAFAEKNFQLDSHIVSVTATRKPEWLVVWPHVNGKPGPKKYQLSLREKTLYCT